MKLRVLFVAIAMMTANQVFSYDFIVDGIAYDYDASDQSAIVTFETTRKYEGDIVIPNHIIYNGRTMKVKGIGSGAFSGCSNLQTITIPETIQTIGQGAFQNCGISNVKLPDSLERLEKYTFKGSELQEIDLPRSLQYIAEGCFDGTKKLKQLIIDGTKSTKGFCTVERLKETGVDYLYLNGVNYSGNDKTYINSSKKIKKVVIGSGFFSIYGAIPDQIDELIIEDSKEDANGLVNFGFAGGICFKAKNAYWGRNFIGSGDYTNEFVPIRLDNGLKELTIGQFATKGSKTIYYDNYFSDCDSLRILRVNFPEPDNRGYFSNSVYLNATLYVPIGSKEKYQNAKGWKNFWNIEEWDFVNDIKHICDESKREQCVYNLQGQKQIEKQKGFNIVRYSDGRTRKVFVK